VAIDLSAAYAKAVREALPAALLVADRFHVGALATDMLTQVRQRVIPETQGRRGRKTDPAWANRRRLLTAHERLRPETFARMWNSLIDTGDPGVQILQASVVKEELRALLNLSGTNPERHLIRRGWIASTSRQPPLTHPRHTAWPPPSRPGGPRSRPPSPPGTPTPDPRATTAWPNTKDVTLSGSATQSTSDVEYGGPVPASTGGPQPREARCPVKSEEPARLSVPDRASGSGALT